MRPHTLVFRLSAATAVSGLLLAQSMPLPALAQPAPPGPASVAPDQPTGDPPERAGWLSQVSGSVSFHTPDEDQWSAAATNYPVSTGDGLWTEPNASAQIMVSDSRIATAGGTELDIGTLDQTGLQATLPQGEAYLRLRNLAPNEAWVVQTPRGLVTFSGAGRYGVTAGDTQDPTTVTVLEGGVQVTGPGVSLQVGPGQTATISGTQTFQGSVGPAQMDAFLTAMQRPERPPPAPAVAPPPVVAQMPGGDDLSLYGTWSQSTDYGQVWYPQVAAGWAPYHDGHWAYVAPWGWTWVDAAPWGFAPFHYGRWFQVGGRWGWSPGVVAVTGPPVYAPALVAFIGIGVGMGIGAALASGSVGWVPLGPREPYYPWYHTSPTYLRSVNRFNVTNVTVINNRNITINNFANRGAMTVVPAGEMAESRPVNVVAEHVDPHVLATARPVIGTPPIRPTVATAGVTPGLAQRMRLPPSTSGTAAFRPAPGPPIRAAPAARGVAARPPLAAPVNRPAGAPPTGAAEHPAPGVRPGVVAAPGAPGRIEHPVPRAPEAAGHEPTPAQIVRPGASPAGPVHPGETAARPAAERPAVVAPHPEGAPVQHAPTPEVHPAPRPEAHPAPRPEEHAAPRPEVHAAPPRPVEHAAPPRPVEHAAERPAPRPAPPRPEERAVARPAPHPAPARHEEQKPGER